MDTIKLRRRAVAAVLAAGCVVGSAAVLSPASASTARPTTTSTRVTAVTRAPAAVPTNTTPPSITVEYGTTAVNKQATADPGVWDTDGLTFAYTWQIDGVDIAGATDATYTPTFDDRTKSLTVTVTASNGTETSAPVVSAASVVDNGDIDYLTYPAISGDTTAGGVLVGYPGTWDVDTAVAGYQWYVDYNPIAGATSSTYTVRPGDVGHGISLGIFLTAPDYYPATAFGDQVQITQGTLTNQVAPRVTGTPAVGQTLTVEPGTWSDTDAVTFTYQWTVGGTPVKGATKTTFAVPGADAGKKIAVVESAGGDAWIAASKTSATVTAAKAPSKVALKLSSPGKGKLTAKVVVTAAVTATGHVTLKIGKLVRTVTLHGGKATVTVSKLAKGATKVKAAYAGSTAVATGSASGSARVK